MSMSIITFLLSTVTYHMTGLLTIVTLPISVGLSVDVVATGFGAGVERSDQACFCVTPGGFDLLACWLDLEYCLLRQGMLFFMASSKRPCGTNL